MKVTYTKKEDYREINRGEKKPPRNRRRQLFEKEGGVPVKIHRTISVKQVCMFVKVVRYWHSHRTQQIPEGPGIAIRGERPERKSNR